VSRPTGWLVTPAQAIIGRKGPFKYRLYFGAGGLVLGLLVGITQGIRIGQHTGGHEASAEGPKAVKAPTRPRWSAATPPRGRRLGRGRPSAEPETASAEPSTVTHEEPGTRPAQSA
jgi:hypothetical protein